MNSLGLVIICGFLVTGFAVAAEEPLSAENLAYQVSGKRNEQITRSVLPRGKEQEILAVLRKRRSYDTLFRLNDQPAIDEFMAKYRRLKGLDRFMIQTLVRCKAPFILDELAPSLYEGPDLERRQDTGGEHSDYGYADTTAAAMSAIIAGAPEFPEAVRKSVGRGLAPRSLRPWWEENQQALREERYGDVKPVIPVGINEIQPRPQSSEPAPRSLSPLDEPPSSKPPTTPVGAVLQGPEASSSVSELAQAPAVPVEKRAPAWIWAMVVLVIAGSVAFAWRRRT